MVYKDRCYDANTHTCSGECQSTAIKCPIVKYSRGFRNIKPTRKEMVEYMEEQNRDAKVRKEFYESIEGKKMKEKIKKIINESIKKKGRVY